MSHAARWITAALLLVASSLVAQEPVLEPGAKVRVTAPEVADEPLEGTYWGVRDDGSLAMTAESTEEPISVPLVAISGIELGVKKRRTVRGLVVLGLCGGLLGAARAAAPRTFSMFGQTCEDTGSCPDYATSIAVGIIGLGAVGAAVGSIPRTEWEPVELPAKPLVAVQPTGRVSVGLTIPVRR